MAAILGIIASITYGKVIFYDILHARGVPGPKLGIRTDFRRGP